MFVPSQLVLLIKMARSTPKPYNVTAVQSSDVIDWKTYSQSRGVLRVRSAESGVAVDWTKFMQISLNKKEPDKIKFKFSHKDDTFEVLKLGETRRHSTQVRNADPHPLYPSGYRRISGAKYKDLQSLCSGPTPVVLHPDHKMFYQQLHH